MKKLLALLISAMTILSFCGFTADTDPAKVYQQAYEKSAAATKQEAKAVMDMQMELGELTIPMKMDMDMKWSREGGKYLMSAAGSMTAMGETMPFAYYYTDGWYYMDMMGQKIKAPMDMEQMMELSKQMMLQSPTAELFDQVHMDEVGENYRITYKIGNSKMKEFIGQAMGMVNTMGGVSDAAAADTAEILPGTMNGQMTVDGKANILSERMSMNLYMKIADETVKCAMRMKASYEPVGKDFAITFPDDLASYQEQAVPAA